MIVSRTGYTGELGFELYFDSAVETGEKVWHALMKAGSAYGIRPVGLGARDTLRLEMGYCLYGNDIDETTNPLEAGLGWITKLDKGDFIGRDELARVKRDGLKRKLSGFILEEPKGFPRHGYEIRHGGVALGHVTSGTISPVLEKGIGLGYVAADSSKPGSPVGVVIREKEVAARIARVPFVGKDTSGAS
jgi:aminomethyltransferase